MLRRPSILEKGQTLPFKDLKYLYALQITRHNLGSVSDTLGTFYEYFHFVLVKLIKKSMNTCKNRV